MLEIKAETKIKKKKKLKPNNMINNSIRNNLPALSVKMMKNFKYYRKAKPEPSNWLAPYKILIG